MVCVRAGSKQGVNEGSMETNRSGKENEVGEVQKYITRTGTEIEVETGRGGLGPGLRIGGCLGGQTRFGIQRARKNRSRRGGKNPMD